MEKVSARLIVGTKYIGDRQDWNAEDKEDKKHFYVLEGKDEGDQQKKIQSYGIISKPLQREKLDCFVKKGNDCVEADRLVARIASDPFHHPEPPDRIYKQTRPQRQSVFKTLKQALPRKQEGYCRQHHIYFLV
jgi:hypothetical protein